MIVPEGHYVYAHYKPDGQVFYIGKGSGKRAWQKARRNRHWLAVVEKYGYEIKIWASGLTQERAYQVEQDWVQLYGRRDLKTGNLVNQNEGGLGGLIPSNEIRKIMSDKKLGRKLTNEHRQKLSERRKGKPLSEEHKRNLAKSKIGNKHGLGKKRTKCANEQMSLTRFMKNEPMPNNPTGQKNISFDGKTYRVQFTVRGKSRYVGKFKTLDLAINARDKFREEFKP